MLNQYITMFFFLFTSLSMYFVVHYKWQLRLGVSQSMINLVKPLVLCLIPLQSVTDVCKGIESHFFIMSNNIITLFAWFFHLSASLWKLWLFQSSVPQGREYFARELSRAINFIKMNGVPRNLTLASINTISGHYFRVSRPY